MFGSIKSAYDIAKDLTEFKVSTEYKTQVSELLDALVQARLEAADAAEEKLKLIEEVRSLQQQLDDRASWSNEKQKYRLARIGDSAAVFILKKEHLQGEKHHLLCAQCFDSGKKGYLQPSAKSNGPTNAHRCSSCSCEVAIDRFSLHDLREQEE